LSTLNIGTPDILIKENEGGGVMVTVRVRVPSLTLPDVTAAISECLGRFSFSHEILAE
jgi:hypothetical protein